MGWQYLKMSYLDDLGKIKKEEINPAQKYPIIWKMTKCEVGECREARLSHRWSIPASVPSGMMTECYDCHKTRLVKTDVEPDIWIIKPSPWAKERLDELNAVKSP